MPLELGDEATLLALTRDTAPQVTGPWIGPALQCGAQIQRDMVRYVWKVNVQNLDPVNPHTLFLFAGDAANTIRRLIKAYTIPAAGSIDLPLNGAHVQSPDFKVPPITSVAPVQEDGIYILDEAGGALMQVVLSQYDLRG